MDPWRCWPAHGCRVERNGGKGGHEKKDRESVLVSKSDAYAHTLLFRLTPIKSLLVCGSATARISDFRKPIFRPEALGLGNKRFDDDDEASGRKSTFGHPKFHFFRRLQTPCVSQLPLILMSLLRDSMLGLPTDIHSLLVKKPSSFSSDEEEERPTQGIKKATAYKRADR